MHGIWLSNLSSYPKWRRFGPSTTVSDHLHFSAAATLHGAASVTYQPITFLYNGQSKVHFSVSGKPLFFFLGFENFVGGCLRIMWKLRLFFLFGFHYVQFMADEGLVPWLEDYLYGLGINIYAVIISTSLNSNVNFGNLTHNHIWIMSWIYCYLYIYFIIIFSHGFVLFAEGTQGFCDPNPTNMLIMRKWSQM